MHFVGLDLAWGEVRPTGVAVLDETGRLVHVSAATDDDSITTALAPYVEGDCVVAVDAPLVVVNATGTRPAEAALNRDFRRFDAGAHPANTGKPEFANGTRGGRLASLLGLDVDPASTSRRRAVEVYPHPAMVALFRLDRTLKYKNKPGRDLESLRSELLRLVGLIESLAGHDPAAYVGDHPAWLALRTAVETAPTKADLRRAEDPVDAVVCAYLALFVARRPDAVTTYGDAETGAILTPTYPQVTADPAAAAIRAYDARLPALHTATDAYVALVTRLLDEAGINYLTVTGRTKSATSYAAKALRTDAQGRRVFDDPAHQIADAIGVRVVTYLRDDVGAVADLLADQLRVLDDRDMGRETADEGRWGYASRHLLAALDPARAAPEDLALIGGEPASVQVRTVLQHAWAEFEHEVRYKATIPPEHVSDLDRRFTLAAGLLELADREFSAIRDRLAATSSDPGAPGSPHDDPDDDPRIGSQELAGFLAGRYAGAGWSRTDRYAWISGLLLELGIASLAELSDVLSGVDDALIDERMAYRYPPGAVRRLDDALLWCFGGRYVDLHGNADRRSALVTRLEKLRVD